MKNLIEKFLFWFKSTQVLKLISDPRDWHFKELLLGEYKPKYSSKILAPYFIENQYGLAVCSFEAWANALAANVRAAASMTMTSAPTPNPLTRATASRWARAKREGETSATRTEV